MSGKGFLPLAAQGKGSSTLPLFPYSRSSPPHATGWKSDASWVAMSS
jgi:hypothetical protein